MAIAKGKETVESAGFKRFVGVASCFVKAVNPTKKEMEALYGREIEKEPEYVTESENADGKSVKSARISFIVQPNPDKYGDVGLFTHTYFIRREYRYNKDKSKVQVIDKYGRTAWVTVEQAKNHEIPVYSNGPANLDKDYRPAYVGEEELTKFISTYLNIPSVMRMNDLTKEWYLVEHPEDCECRLDEIEKYFKNDVSEIQGAIALQPKNEIKILFTVRNSDDNKQYQGSYTRMVLRNRVTDYSKLDKDVQEMRNMSTSASVANTEYYIGDFKEYTVTPTEFTPVESTPFDMESSDGLPFDL